jgi:multidrug efflux pump subunit AcrA (membrane-fusion protein)
MKRIISQYPWVTALVVVMIILATYFIFLRKAPSREEGFTVTRRTITKEVVTTGKVVASQNVSLAFENSGRVSRVNALVGTTVRPRDDSLRAVKH